MRDCSPCLRLEVVQYVAVKAYGGQHLGWCGLRPTATPNHRSPKHAFCPCGVVRIGYLGRGILWGHLVHFAGFFGDLRAASSAAAFSACFSARVLRGLAFLVSLASCVSFLTLGLSLAWG